MKYFVLLLLTSLSFNSFAQMDDEVKLFAKWLEGKYTTEGETVQPPRTEHETMRFVRIWKDLPDLWIYMEQAHADEPEKPFRQWLFWVEKQGENLMLETNILADTVDLPGNLSAAELEQQLDIDMTEIEKGCEIFMAYDGFAVFSGATVQAYCELEIRGSDYVTIRMNLSETGIDWWEYGMKRGGEFVWGSAHDHQTYRKLK